MRVVCGYEPVIVSISLKNGELLVARLRGYNYLLSIEGVLTISVSTIYYIESNCFYVDFSGKMIQQKPRMICYYTSLPTFEIVITKECNNV